MTKEDFALGLKNELPFSKKDAIVFTEDQDDKDFWQTIFKQFAPNLALEFFNGALPLGENKQATGRNAVLAYQEFADVQLLLCVDSDYHYLLDDEAITSDFVFQTYAYSIENYQCFPDNLNHIFEEITQKENEIFDFEAFLKGYSSIIYELFLYALTNQVVLNNLWDIIALNETGFINIADLGKALEVLKQKVTEKLNELQGTLIIDNFRDYKANMQLKGLNPESTYLFVRGKNLQNSVVIPLLKSVVEKIKLLQYEEFKKLEREEAGKKIREYQSNLKNIEQLLKEYRNYYSCPLMTLIAKGIEQFLSFKNAL